MSINDQSNGGTITVSINNQPDNITMPMYQEIPELDNRIISGMIGLKHTNSELFAKYLYVSGVPVEIKTTTDISQLFCQCGTYTTCAPTADPTMYPTIPTKYPTSNPTNDPSENPTNDPTTAEPTSISPTVLPTTDPTINPTSDSIASTDPIASGPTPSPTTRKPTNDGEVGDGVQDNNGTIIGSNRENNEESGSPTTAILAAVIVLIICCIVGVVAYFLWKARRNKEVEGGEENMSSFNYTTTTNITSNTTTDGPSNANMTVPTKLSTTQAEFAEVPANSPASISNVEMTQDHLNLMTPTGVHSPSNFGKQLSVQSIQSQSSFVEGSKNDMIIMADEADIGYTPKGSVVSDNENDSQYAFTPKLMAQLNTRQDVNDLALDEVENEEDIMVVTPGNDDNQIMEEIDNEQDDDFVIHGEDEGNDTVWADNIETAGQ